MFKYHKKVLLPILNGLGDKAALMRADVIATASKWGEAIGAEHVINDMCTYLEKGNPELRKASLTWICEHKDAIQKCDHPAMVKPLVHCLNDRAKEIRVMADDVIVSVMTFSGFAPFQDGIRDLKPAV